MAEGRSRRGARGPRPPSAHRRRPRRSRKKYASTASWAAGEQSGAQAADEATLVALRDGNVAYEARYGHLFVVCATGKSASEMLAILEGRMHNAPDDELRLAATEQGKITRIRLEKLA